MTSILIVDDNPQIRKLVRVFLESEPTDRIYEEAVDGVDAIEKAKELKPNLVILDFSMPRMNGLDTARVLRAMDRQVLIILFTLYEGTIAPADASAAGIDAMVSKSDLAGLLKHVGNVLQSVPE